MELSILFGLNLPCALMGLLMNMFYMFCLIFPLGGKIRQPLMTLLVLMVASTSGFQLSLIAYLALELTHGMWDAKEAVRIFLFYMIRTSIPGSLFLYIFYCIQIVPVTKAPFIWLKKNIKTVVYGFLIFTNIYFIMYFALELFMSFGLFSTQITFESNNTTINVSYTFTTDKSVLEAHMLLGTMDILTTAMVFLSSVVMLTVTSITGGYLYQHVKKMTSSGMPFNSQALQNQVRVIITSFIQGFLYLFCSAVIFVYLFFVNENFDWAVFWMIFNLYLLATTTTLGVGQSLFRQRAADLCRRAGHLPST